MDKFVSFGFFEWTLAGMLAWFFAYLLYSVLKRMRPVCLSRYSPFLLVVIPLFLLVLPFIGEPEPGWKLAGYRDINPYSNVSFKPDEDSQLSFSPSSPLQENHPFRYVSTPKEERRLGSEAHSVSQTAAESYPPSGQNHGVVPANLNTTAAAAPSPDPVRPAGFQAPSSMIPKTDLSSADLSFQNSSPSASPQETIDRGLETTKLASVYIEAKIHKPGSKIVRESDETGSGFIIMTRTGDFYVLTNNHVAGDPVSNDEVTITLNDRRQVHPIRVVSSPQFDIAVLQLDRKDILPPSLLNADVKTLNAAFASHEANLTWNPATLGNSDQVRVAETVWAIGAPFGLEGTVTKGIVSGLDRHGIPLGTDHQIQGFIQTDASINPGNSGGPLVNDQGKVIGVVLAIASKTGVCSGVSFAIPINNAVRVADQLIKDGVYTNPYIGVKLDRDFTDAEKINAGLFLEETSIAGTSKRAGGARVQSVVPHSPADQVGLRSGDIIIRYNNKTIQNEEHLEYLIYLSRVNEVSEIEILRDGKVYSAKPQLTDRRRMAANNESSEKIY